MSDLRGTVVVLDYGSGNLRSAERAVARTGVDVVVTADPEVALAAPGLVVPGVGAYAACMAGLRAVGGPDVIAARQAAGLPTLAICVGHQVLFEAGIEHGVEADGVGVWPGVVERLQSERLPHMGWNTVAPAAGSRLFGGVGDERFYFVHSYGVRALAEKPGRLVTWAEHGGDRFVAAVEEGALWSTQFHPEKSGDAGARLIANWVATLSSPAA
ncbi:imidazole glycerol phosphate synthase subunit HisH [Microlunatus antarcticus]|uniref:Imidazole glycerol phosphate synthase subunit HisH n=1 Tax=Microlunatus antarcticus TaxID=53388 RepID=A0A7W5JWG2_9ACTN|nr:imidazole glycerol phosphate synthase subunit HisH [Microlunatus antarcticus]MBB3327341.1 glutamine amidotransferase [Microlunatus antarcticus]